MSKLIVTGCERMDQLSREETVDRRQVFHSHMQTTEIQVIHHFNKIDEPGIEKPSAPVFLALHMPAGNRFILPEKLERQYLSRQQPTSIYVASSSTGENLTPSDHIYIISREIQPDPKKK